MPILNGWKEIANYLGRGIRTVQRWEALGLPIRRPSGKARSAVFAISEELDRWATNAPAIIRDTDLLSLRHRADQALADHKRYIEAVHASARSLEETRRRKNSG